MFWIDVVSRVLHILTAITLIGGATFIALVLHPVTNRLDEAQRDSIRESVVGRWKMFIHIGILIFLLTGFYNYFRAIELHRGDGLYHAFLGTKMLLAFWVMFLASVLVGRSQRFAGLRQNMGLWSKVLVVSAFLIVAISGFVKVRGIPDKPADEIPAATNPISEE